MKRRVLQLYALLAGRPPNNTTVLLVDEILHHFETMVETMVCWYL